MEWISVRDKTPEYNQKCLIYTIDKKMFVARYDNWSDVLEEVSDFYLTNVNFGMIEDVYLGHARQWGLVEPTITHWMPLPEPPKDK